MIIWKESKQERKNKNSIIEFFKCLAQTKFNSNSDIFDIQLKI